MAELATQVRGVTYKKADASSEPRPDTVGVVRAGNIEDGELTLSDLVYIPRELVSDKQRLEAGDVLVATSSGSLDVVGKAARVRSDQAVAFGAFCKVLRPGAMVDPGYFAHYFLTPWYRAHVSRVAAGANINNLRKADLDDIEVPLPPIEEQRRIAAVLDRADELRAKRREALAKLDILTQAIFIDIFGDPAVTGSRWPLGIVGDVIESATYGTSKKAGPDGEYPVLRMGNLTIDGRLSIDDLKFVDLAEHEVEKHTVRHGDVLFNRTNSADLVGKTALYDRCEPMAYAGYLIRLRPASSMRGEYLAKYMNLPPVKQRLRSMCKSIIGMANINAREVSTIPIPVPPIELQSQYALLEQRVKEAARQQVHQLATLDSLFAALQQRAFRGEL